MSSTATRQSVQQKRAAFALKKVRALASKSSEDRKKLKARASELPFMIHANGLGQALAFFSSKKDKDGYGELRKILEGWLATEDNVFAGKTDVLQALMDADQRVYCMAQTESLLLLDWVKKFASAFLDGEGAAL